MMSRHFRLNSELSGAIAKRLPHAKNQLSPPSSFFNQFVTEIYIQWNLYIAATQGIGQNWPLYTGDRYIQVIVLIPKRDQRRAINIKFLDIYYLK